MLDNDGHRTHFTVPDMPWERGGEAKMEHAEAINEMLAEATRQLAQERARAGALEVDLNRLLGLYGDHDFHPTVDQAVEMNREERAELRRLQATQRAEK